MSKVFHENYLILGVPRAGKTTFFCSMATHLQKVANSTRRLNFRYCDTNTSRFIDSCMEKLKNQEWPDKTQLKSELDYSFQLEYERRFLGIHICTDTVDILYHDYPGEAFTTAFSEEQNSGMYINDAEDLKKRIETAAGIFLLLDAKEMFNQNNIREMSESLTALFKYLRSRIPAAPKLAIIFNKAELINDYNHNDFIKRFRQDYGNAYAWIPPLHKFFTAYPLGSCCINKNGESIPPPNLKPRDILRPANWMIKFL